MPRHIRATAREVQKARAEWYEFHYEHRQLARALTPEQLQNAQYSAAMVSPPTMTVFGGLPAEWPERQAYHFANRYRLDVSLINPWYVSEAGWEQFQSLWQQLPEPVDLYTERCVQIGDLYTLSTMPGEARPPA